MKGITSALAGLITLLLWLQIAGPANPHVVELSLGLVLAIGVGAYAYFSGIPKMTSWWEEKVSKAKSFVKDKARSKQ